MKQVLTKDGSVTFYSEEYMETYHSVSGAVEESLRKFAEPCGIRELAISGHVRILDICFGLGYNSCAAIDTALKENPECRIEIVALEKDIKILDEIKNLNPSFKNYKIIKDLIKNENHKIIQDLIKNNFKFKNRNIEMELMVGRAEETITSIKNIKFNAVFLDPFSPPKNPELWTLHFLKNARDLMEKGATLATYSCAKKVRENLKASGFIVKDGSVVGRRAPATVAVNA